jgi:hypothetical protein
MSTTTMKTVCFMVHMSSSILSHPGLVHTELFVPTLTLLLLVLLRNSLLVGFDSLVSVKTATRGFPKNFLSSVELAKARGDFLALKKFDPPNAEEVGAEMAAFVWMDREYGYFISTTGSLEAGTPYTRCRWRQLDPSPDAPPQRVQMTIQQPKIAESLLTQHVQPLIGTIGVDRCARH